MSGIDGHGLCSFSEVREYLLPKGDDWLLKYVRERDGRYELVEEQYSVQNTPSIRYQIACVFMLLGEYSTADKIHRLNWGDLSSWGDKVGNDLLKHFMRSWQSQ